MIEVMSNTAKNDLTRNIIIDISDCRISNNPEDVLITYALGSCIAVILYDPAIKAGGLLHYQLPLSEISPDKAKDRPAMFADTGIPLLFQMMKMFGSKKKDLIVKVAGGGQIADENGTFNIGKRNYVALRKIFWQNEVVIAAEDVGGTKSRTVKLYIQSGKVVVISNNEVTNL